MLSSNQQLMFFTTLAEWKPRNQNILDMAKSPDFELHNKAIRSVKQIVKSILEAQVLTFDAHGNIINIGTGTGKGFESKILSK